ncbi:sirtuin [Dichomitus squalens]|uniref:Sirtuin n=1 Tax=Dichomitus squalens TaxID=114155 RepID=A0A4V6MWD8_9APHY|nr:sirtuin [Dichomitus squalens]TBU65225.1 sirtuin [Dichomitus squalens]
MSEVPNKVAVTQPSNDLDAFCIILKSSKCPGILTGAGLSAASGITTYRGTNGQWLTTNPMEVASLQAFQDNPGRVWAYYHPKRDQCMEAKPNAAHYALASLSLPSIRAQIFPNLVQKDKPPLYVTQNFDGLCRRALDETLDKASSPEDQLDADERNEVHARLVEMHGSCYRFTCTQCKCVKTTAETPLAPIFTDQAAIERAKNGEERIAVEQLPRCGGPEWSGSNRYGRCGGLLRPGIVWFGEIPEGQGEITRILTKVDVLLVVGTSSLVHPAATYATTVKKNGGTVAVFNLAPSQGDDKADFVFYGPCEETVPALLERARQMVVGTE